MTDSTLERTTPTPQPNRAVQADTLGLLLAGGRGERLGGDKPKGFRSFRGHPLLHHGLSLFEACPSVARVVLVVPKGNLHQARELCPHERFSKLAQILEGGETRQDSCRIALEAEAFDLRYVAVHDAARPLTSVELTEGVIQAAREASPNGGAVPSRSIHDSACLVNDRQVTQALSRAEVRLTQTPQVFGLADLHNIQRQAQVENQTFTDEAGLMAHYGFAVSMVDHEEDNPKMTTLKDWRKAEQHATMPRIGQGYDVHRLMEGRPLILAGVTIPHDMGLLGHSDADVATHAVADALLGACALGDLGHFFPENDPAFKDADSLALLAEVVTRCAEAGFVPAQVDLTLLAQAPKLAPYREAMIANLATVLKLETSLVSVKFTTTEGLGFCGREEGMAAHAVVLMRGQNPPSTIDEKSP